MRSEARPALIEVAHEKRTKTAYDNFFVTVVGDDWLNTQID
jgi:hypothetical protein